jgi:hypothetical protein
VPVCPKVTAIQVLLLLATRVQLDALALTANEPFVASPRPRWIEDGFNVRVHWAAAGAEAAIVRRSRYKDFKMV